MSVIVILSIFDCGCVFVIIVQQYFMLLNEEYLVRAPKNVTISEVIFFFWIIILVKIEISTDVIVHKNLYCTSSLDIPWQESKRL
jgi:hypothetical protein